MRAIFVGHFHGRLGRCTDYESRFGNVPVFHSGAALRETFLMAQKVARHIKPPEQYVHLGKSSSQLISIDSAGAVSHPSGGLMFKAIGHPEGNLFDLQAPDGKFLCWSKSKPYDFYLGATPTEYNGKTVKFTKRSDGVLISTVGFAVEEKDGRLVHAIDEDDHPKDIIKPYSASGGNWTPPPAYQETEFYLNVSQYSSRGGLAKLLKEETPVRIW